MIPRGFISIIRFETQKNHLQKRPLIASIRQGPFKGRLGARVVLQLRPTKPQIHKRHGKIAAERIFPHAIQPALRLDKTPL